MDYLRIFFSKWEYLDQESKFWQSLHFLFFYPFVNEILKKDIHSFCNTYVKNHIFFRVKGAGESDKRKVEKLEKDLNIANDKSEKTQRDYITLEREKRKSEDEKAKVESSIGKLEGEMRMISRY